MMFSGLLRQDKVEGKDREKINCQDFILIKTEDLSVDGEEAIILVGADFEEAGKFIVRLQDISGDAGDMMLNCHIGD